MKVLVFLWIASKLIFSLLRFGVILVWGLYPTQILAGTSLVIALLISIIYIQATGLLQPLLPMIDTSQLRAEQQRWLSLVERYPTHRDILLNTAILEDKLALPQQAAEHWRQARYQDPNASFFTTNTLSGYSLPSSTPKSLSQH